MSCSHVPWVIVLEPSGGLNLRYFLTRIFWSKAPNSCCYCSQTWLGKTRFAFSVSFLHVDADSCKLMWNNSVQLVFKLDFADETNRDPLFFILWKGMVTCVCVERWIKKKKNIVKDCGAFAAATQSYIVLPANQHFLFWFVLICSCLSMH